MIIVLSVGALPALARDGDTLDATVESKDGSFSFAYPPGWYVDDFLAPDFFYTVATSAWTVALMTAEEPTYPSGQVMLNILRPPASSLAFSGEESVTMDEALTILLSTGTNATIFEEPEATTIGDYDALIADSTTPQYESLLIGVDLGNDHFALASVKAAPGEFSQFEDTVMAILASITYTDVVAFESPAGDLAFEYPVGWLVLEMTQGTVTITNGMLDGTLLYVPHSGQVIVNIATPPAANSWADSWLSVEERGLGQVSDVTVGDFTGTRLDFTTGTQEGYALLLDVDGRILGIQVTTAPGELDDFDAEVTAILESVEYTPVESTTE
jgi:hypothetical protein